jgi:hypothetical protein
VRPQPFHLTRTENPGLAITPRNVTAAEPPGERNPLSATSLGTAASLE